MSADYRRNQTNPVFRFFGSILMQLSVSILLIIGALSMMYGKFPPPFHKIKHTFYQYQSLMASGPAQFGNLKGNQARLNQAANEVSADGEQSAPSMMESVAERPAYIAEIQSLKFKVQSLEARQEIMEAEISKLRGLQKIKSPTVNR